MLSAHKDKVTKSTTDSPATLYELCLRVLCSMVNASVPLPSFDKLGGIITEDLLIRASKDVKYWREVWKVFLTPKISSAILKWDKNLLEFVGSRCKNLKRVLFQWCGTQFEPSYLKLLPQGVCSVDFDGELYHKGRSSFPEFGESSWLPEAGVIFKALWLSRKRLLPLDEKRLVELHLGTMTATADQLIIVLQHTPQLKLLRHYQLVSALYKLHSETWRSGGSLPNYKLHNLDADFSHVVRCRMSPQAVLPGDAMRLATILCPDVSSVKIRIDCSTPHDILAPLTGVKKLKELSIVCVTSGERCNLDFSDISPVLESHGDNSLTSLELKVIEEVDSHVIVSMCPKLESLVLSGCGYISPSTCANFACASKSWPLRRLRLLFYADGDDFSWTHNVPQCFWKSALLTTVSKRSRLMGLFLESPSITETTTKELWPAAQFTLYPELQVVSLCRYDEATLDNIKNLISGAPLKYLRASNCERLHPKRLLQMCQKRDLVIYTT